MVGWLWRRLGAPRSARGFLLRGYCRLQMMLGALCAVLLVTSCYGAPLNPSYEVEGVADVVAAPSAELLPGSTATAQEVGSPLVSERTAPTVTSEHVVSTIDPVASTGHHGESVPTPVLDGVFPDGQPVGSLHPLAVLNRASSFM